MTPTSALLENLSQALKSCEQGHASTSELVRNWRQQATQLPLPERYSEVLSGLLDRMESSALFSEESCSFSQRDQLDALKIWLQKAQHQLAMTSTPDSAQTAHAESEKKGT